MSWFWPPTSLIRTPLFRIFITLSVIFSEKKKERERKSEKKKKKPKFENFLSQLCFNSLMRLWCDSIIWPRFNESDVLLWDFSLKEKVLWIIYFLLKVVEHGRETDGQHSHWGPPMWPAWPLPVSHTMRPLSCAPGQAQVLTAWTLNQIPRPSQRVGELIITLNKVLKLARVAFWD